MENDEHWNSINLISPPFNTYSVSRKTFDIKLFKKYLEDAITYFSQHKSFYEEVSQISQFIYLGANQYKMMKGFQEMKKTHQAGVRLKRLDIVSIMEAFNSYVADDFQLEILIPCRQNLDYLLIKLQGFSKVLMRIITCSRKSSRYFMGVIKNGSFYIKGSVIVSTLAKVWDSSRQMCQYAVMLYNNLIQFREKLHETKNCEWIANNCTLPEKLEEWLGDEYEFFVNNETYDSKMLIKPKDIDDFRKRILQITDIFGKFKTEDRKVLTNDDRNDSTFNEEIKNEIEDFTPISRNKISQSHIEYDHSVESLQTKESVKLFLKYEGKYRKQNLQKSITIKKLKQKVWKEFKNDLKNKLLLMSESSLVEYFHDNLNHYLKSIE